LQRTDHEPSVGHMVFAAEIAADPICDLLLFAVPCDGNQIISMAWS
jgi:hypothetical protein